MDDRDRESLRQDRAANSSSQTNESVDTWAEKAPDDIALGDSSSADSPMTAPLAPAEPPVFSRPDSSANSPEPPASIASDEPGALAEPMATRDVEPTPAAESSEPEPSISAQLKPPAVPLASDGNSPRTQPSASSPQSSRNLMRMVAYVVVGLVILAGVTVGAYHSGNSRGYKSGKNAQTMATTAATLKVPANATMIAQCTPGEGTQYVLPANIPHGPIYNVWNGKITGLEYMMGVSEIASMKTQNLLLKSQQYNHIDVTYEAAGHAGFTEPHYHMILSFIPYGEEQKITCGSAGMSM